MTNNFTQLKFTIFLMFGIEFIDDIKNILPNYSNCIWIFILSKCI